jgi:hypothetical protein
LRRPGRASFAKEFIIQPSALYLLFQPTTTSVQRIPLRRLSNRSERLHVISAFPQKWTIDRQSGNVRYRVIRGHLTTQIDEPD